MTAAALDVTRGPEQAAGVRVTALRRYPVKSCREQELPAATVEAQGFAGDRRWMLVDHRGRFLSARRHPRLVLVTAEPTTAGLRLVAPGAEPLEVPTPAGGPAGMSEVWGDPVELTWAGAAADAWFGAFLGAEVRLGYQLDPTSRPTEPGYTTAADRVSLADGYPVLLAAEESLAVLNDWIAADPGGEGPVDMRRFRPNVVVAGGAAFAEDGWRRVRIGPATFRVAKTCGRCVLTVVDPDTGRKGREPLRTLTRRRLIDGLPRFAVNLLPDLDDGTVGATVTVGDPLEVVG